MKDWATEAAEEMEDAFPSYVLFEPSVAAAIMREYGEERGWRARYEEASLKIDRLVLECQRVDLMQSEIDDIQIMVGCNHVEGLASCVRARIDDAPWKAIAGRLAQRLRSLPAQGVTRFPDARDRAALKEYDEAVEAAP